MTGDRSNQNRETIRSTTKQPTVMLIEDCEVDRAAYRRYLSSDREHDYHIVAAETGEAALKIYPQYQPDLILLDYLLPDMDGLEWLRLWRQQDNNYLCPVIVLTGQGDEGIAVQFIKLGAADYLVKSKLTAEKLKFSVSKEIALQEEKQQVAQKIESQTQQLQTANQLLQTQIDRCELSEKLIRNSEEKLRRAIANAPLPIIIHAEDGEVLQINQAWTELSGYTIEDIPTITQWTAKAYGEKQQAVQSSIDRLYQLNRRVDEGEYTVTTARGEVRIWDFSSAPLGRLLDGRRLVISTAKDVTEIKQAKIALQKSEAKFRNTFEQAAVGMAHVALNGKWLMVNQKLCQIVGYTAAELLQSTFLDLTYPEDLAADLEYVHQLLAGEITTYTLEKRYIHRDQSLIWINLTVSLVRNETGQPEYFISVIEDISDRKKLELDRQKTLQRLSNLHQLDKAIIEAQQPKAIAATALNNIQQILTCQRISIVTFDFDRQTATILVTQGRAKQTTGNGLITSITIWQNLITRLQKVVPNYLVTYLSQLPRLSSTIPALAASGLDCVVCFPLKIQNKLLGILKLWVEDAQVVTSEELDIVQEISTQIAIALQQSYLTQAIQDYAADLENKVQERTAQLEEINQELKAFTYSISHDLKAPLRAIQGFAIALQEDYGENLDDLGQEYTNRLAASAQHMERLIQDLLAYSRLSRTEIQQQTVDLTGVVNNALEDLATEIVQAQAEITVERPLLRVLGNRTILQQIVNNLLSNAIKFVPFQVKPQVHIKTELRDNFVRLWIEDNGIGIEPQHQERIFQVFERLHGNETYPGTGIGLAIAKKGIERLGGKIAVESQLDRGSRFWLELPSSPSSWKWVNEKRCGSEKRSNE